MAKIGLVEVPDEELQPLNRGRFDNVIEEVRKAQEGNSHWVTFSVYERTGEAAHTKAEANKASNDRKYVAERFPDLEFRLVDHKYGEYRYLQGFVKEGVAAELAPTIKERAPRKPKLGRVGEPAAVEGVSGE
jgi:hypothetical protein